MDWKRIGRILFFGLIALILLSEAFLSNLGSLGNIEEVAADIGLTVSAERTRLYILAILDLIGGIGAVIALVGILQNKLDLRKNGTLLTTIGLILYGLYQLISANSLAEQWRTPVMIVGIVYALLGVAAWFIGKGSVSAE